MVSSETLPSRLPTRPALSIGGGGVFDACDVSSLSTFSSAFLPTSGASANSSRSCSIFSSTVISCPGSVAVRCFGWHVCHFPSVVLTCMYW